MYISRLATEILLNIFTTIHDDFAWDDPTRATGTLAALARTCMAFKGPALDTLWRDIDGFKPIISCLPEILVERTSEGTLSLKRPLRVGEWEAFAQYAHRIRSLTISRHDLDKISAQVVQALLSKPSSALMSNLRSLHWSDDRSVFVPLLRSLLVPTIRSMKLGSSNSWSAPSSAKSALIASLGAQCPSIREFVCVYYGYSPAISNSVCSWRELFHLRTSVLNTRSLRHLTSLPSLKFLHFMINDFEDPTSHSTATFASQLEQVYIGAPIPHLFARRLRNLRFLSCRSVILSVGEDEMDPKYPPAWLDTLDLMVSFSQCFSPALEHISFAFGYFCREAECFPLVLAFGAVAPLLSFSRLTTLDLNWFFTSTIDDDALKIMAQSWPQLEEFRFGVAAEEHVSPCLTFKGFVHLVQLCPHLREIAMPFCASPMDIACEPFSTTIPNEKITEIAVGISPITNPITVACQLHTLLPKLTYVDARQYLGFPLPHQFQYIRDDWERVVDSLELLVAGAQTRTKHAELIASLKDSGLNSEICL